MIAPTTLDLFSGAGGFTTGATKAGANVIWAANHEPTAVACHSENHPGVEHVEQDLGEMDWTLCPEADLLIASPACQGHSPAAQPGRKGTGGNSRPNRRMMTKKGQRDRNTSWAVLAAADTIRPGSIVVENVPWLQDWELFDAWLNILQAMGYSTRAHVLNGMNYGGAQDRPRTIITASLGPAIELAPKIAEARTIASCLDPDDHPKNNWTAIESKSERMRWRMRKAQKEAGARCFWNNVSESRGRALDEQFPTATTKSVSQWYLLDGERGRVVNAREVARSMSFDDSYKLPANKELAGKLVGNAIDVNLACGVIAQVMEAA